MPIQMYAFLNYYVIVLVVAKDSGVSGCAQFEFFVVHLRK